VVVVVNMVVLDLVLGMLGVTVVPVVVGRLDLTLKRVGLEH